MKPSTKFNLNLFTPLLVLLLAFDAGAASSSRHGQRSRVKRTDISFQENYERYPAPYDLFFHLNRLLPALDIETLSQPCHRLSQENTTVLGGNIPSFGAPLEDLPGALFVELYVKCINEAFDKGLRSDASVTVKNMQAILGDSLLVELTQAATAALGTTGNRSQIAAWSSFSGDLRSRVLKRLIFYFVGPDSLLAEKGLIGKESVFGPEVKTVDDLARFVEKVSLEQAPSQPADLSAVVRGAAILLRLGPTLLN